MERAEHAAEKARSFMDKLDIPQLIDHAETNVDNMTNLINHQDELYLANLSSRATNGGAAYWHTLSSHGIANLFATIILG